MSASSSRFYALFERSPIAQELFDADGWLVSANGAALDLFGVVDERELRETNLFDNPNLPPEARDLLRQGRVVEMDMTYRFGQARYRTTRSGTLRLHLALFPVPDPARGSGGYMLQILDITDKHDAIQMLEASEQTYRSLLTNLQVGWLLVDERMVVEQFQPTPANITGLVPGDLVGKRLEDAPERFGDLRRDIADMARHILASGRPMRLQSVPLPGRGRSGLQRMCHVDVAAFRVKLRGRHLVACIVSDVTDREAMQEQLLQAQKMESIGRIASGLAHDLNNMLSAIIGHAGLVELESRGNADLSESAREIVHAARRAGKLIQRMSAFSRGGARASRDSRQVDLSGVVRTTTSIMGRAFSGRIRLELDLADNLPPVEGDDTRLESAVMNLLVNAVDAMPGGGVVSVRTQVVNVHSWKPGSSPAVGPGRWLRLTVGDTGSGMSSETRRRVFEPFFTTKPPGKGTGLGLYSVYRLVQEMEGHIDIDSAPGRGTTIDIYLPVPGGERSSAGRYTGRASVPPRLRGYETTVLVVDDEDVVLQSVGAMLRRLGYNTLTAASGREALSLLRNTATTVDIVLLDVQMEGMDGEEVLRSMEHDPHRPRVLFMSGCSDPETIEGLDSGGACGFLPKPFTTEQLGERLRSVIEA